MTHRHAITIYAVADACGREHPSRTRERAAALQIEVDERDAVSAVDALRLMRGYNSRTATYYRARIKERLTRG